MAEDEHPTEDDPLRGGAGFEASDANVRAIFWISGGLALLCVFGLLASRWTFTSLTERVDREQRPLHPLAMPDELPPAPLLQAHPPRELDAYQRRQRELLESYGWVDPVEGIVRVPVDRALELVLEEGLPSAAPREQEVGR